jgi:DNA-binding GntR family transcriptional regulator
MPAAIVTRPLRDAVYDRVLAEILEGVRAPGARLRDTELAESFGVSRTPVREALLRLAKEGFLQTDHQRGFRVASLDPTEVRETYPLIIALETAGLRLAGAPDRETLDRLAAWNDRMEASAQPRKRLEIDQQWHRALIDGARNARLFDSLDAHKKVVRRYENRYMTDVERVLASVDEHAAILAALEAEDVELACRRLADHWRRGMEKVLAWIDP